MTELKCPHCGQVFTVDESELDSIVNQIRDSEFKNDMVIIYNTTRYEKDDTLDAFEARVQEEISKAEKNALALNIMDEGLRNQILAKM